MDSKLALRLQEPFNPVDIEWRAQQSGIGNKGKPWMIVLPYITSRAIQQRLDDVFGPCGYEIKQEETKGLDGFVCTISVLDGDRWISKQDVAPKTDIEPLKGGASGALKRAGALWGIGRYLYHLESGFASCQPCDFQSQAKNNYSRIKDKKSGASVGVDWMPPALPDWAMPGLDSLSFSEAIINSKDMAELKAAFTDAYRWASSFGKTDLINQFTEEKDQAKHRLDEQAKDNIADNYAGTLSWLEYQITNLDRVPDAGSVETLSKRINQALLEKCAGQYFDKDSLIKLLKQKTTKRIAECR